MARREDYTNPPRCGVVQYSAPTTVPPPLEPGPVGEWACLGHDVQGRGERLDKALLGVGLDGLWVAHCTHRGDRG